MTTAQMQKIKVDDILLDSFNSSKQWKPITCLVIEVNSQGLLVTGTDKESSIFYYNDLNDRGEELIPWSKSYSVELIDPSRLGECGYITY